MYGRGTRQKHAEEFMAVLIDAIDVKRRTLFELDNIPYSCLEAEVNTPTARGGQTLVRLKIRNLPGMLGKVTSLIGEVGGDIGAIDIAGFEKDNIIRDLTVKVRDSEHGENIVKCLNELEACEVVHVSDRTFLMHLGGKIRVTNKVPLQTRDDLSMAYTPGVARVCGYAPGTPYCVRHVARAIRQRGRFAKLHQSARIGRNGSQNHNAVPSGGYPGYFAFGVCGRYTQGHRSSGNQSRKIENSER